MRSSLYFLRRDISTHIHVKLVIACESSLRTKAVSANDSMWPILFSNIGLTVVGCRACVDAARTAVAHSGEYIQQRQVQVEVPVNTTANPVLQNVAKSKM